MEDNNLIIYKNNDGNIIVDAIYKDETLCLSQKGMSKVYITKGFALNYERFIKGNKYDTKYLMNYLKE